MLADLEVELLSLLDEHQEDSLHEMSAELKKLDRDVENLEFQRLLSDSVQKRFQRAAHK